MRFCCGNRPVGKDVAPITFMYLVGDDNVAFLSTPCGLFLFPIKGVVVRNVTFQQNQMLFLEADLFFYLVFDLWEVISM